MVDFEAEVFAEGGVFGGVGNLPAAEPAGRSRWPHRLMICSLVAAEGAWIGGVAALVWWVLR